MEALTQPLTESLDDGHGLEFGYFLVPDAADPQGVLETMRLVDGLGYDLLGAQDHPYQPRHLDTQSLLATVLAQTTAVRVFADFIEDVAPRVREIVAEQRASSLVPAVPREQNE